MLNSEEIVEELWGETQKNKVSLPFSESIRVWQKGAFSGVSNLLTFQHDAVVYKHVGRIHRYLGTHLTCGLQVGLARWHV